MPITAVRITVKGQQAVSHLVREEAPPNQKRPVPANPEADKLSMRKATILAAVADGKWYPMFRLYRRVADTEEFPEWTGKVGLKSFQDKNLGGKITNELIGLSEQGYLQLGRETPRKCPGCDTVTPELIVAVAMNNETWDGSEARVRKQSRPLCRECFVKQTIPQLMEALNDRAK